MKDHNPKSTKTIVAKNSWMLLLFFLFCWTPGVRALDVWSFPLETEIKSVLITNSQSQPQDLWLSGPNIEMETQFQVPAYGSLEIPMTSFASLAWLRMVTVNSKALHLQLQTTFDQLIYLDPNQTTSWKVRARAGAELVVFNQAPFEQKVQILASGQNWKTLILPAFGKNRVAIDSSASGQVLTITGEARIGGVLIAGENSVQLSANAKAQVLTPPATSARYFRLSNSAKDQSYVVALSDPSLIAQAEEQIRKPWEISYLPRILFARVAFGHGGFNRDFSSKWKAPWSWHVAEVFRFGDFGSQACDGNPEALEQSLMGWSPDGQGIICFWDFRIVEEISIQRIHEGN